MPQKQTTVGNSEETLQFISQKGNKKNL